MKDRIVDFVKGYLYSVFATFVFAAFGWIIVSVTANKFFVLPLVALVTWALVFFLGWALWIICLVLASFFTVLGILFGFGVSAYYLMQVVSYTLPPDLVKFTADEWGLFVMGAFYCCAYLFTTEKRTMKRTKVEA